jgi:ABC-type bacteriocin/lantibiotic exporter with double-glycine peptidase domain
MFIVILATNVEVLESRRDANREEDHAIKYDPGDIACGPRCVKFILDHYGIHRTFLDIASPMAAEMTTQGGVSISTLERALNSHGVYTRAIEVPAKCLPHASEPYIMHIKMPNASSGHYVVVTKAGTYAAIEVWNGLNGTESGSISALLIHASRRFVLTSTRPINGTAKIDVINLSASRFSGMQLAFCAMLLGCCAIFLWNAIRSNHKE